MGSVYDGAGFATNASAELTVLTQFKALSDAMKAAESDLTKKPTATELTTLFEAGTPSLQAITTAAFATKISGWFTAFAAAAGAKATPSNPPVGEGGVFGKFLFDEKGTDLRQVVEKGLLGAALYRHALTVASTAKTDADVDRIVAIFGAHPSFPGDDKAAANPDMYSALYAERRDPKDAANPGHYLTFKAAAVAAQAAGKAGAACQSELAVSVTAMLKEWELSHVATVVFYLNDASKKLTAEPATEATASDGLHAYGEAVGFLHGLRELPAAGRTITDAQIDEVLTLVGAAPGAETSYALVTDAAAEVPKLGQAMQKVVAIYGFSPAQVELYKTNY